MTTTELTDYLMEHGVLKRADAEVMAAEINTERDELRLKLDEWLLKYANLASAANSDLAQSNYEREQLADQLAAERDEVDLKRAALNGVAKKRDELAAKLESAVDDTDEEWITEIGQMHLKMFGTPWETKDGESREEGVSSNITALFQIIEDITKKKDQLEAKCAEMRDQLIQCKTAFNRHGWDTCQLDGVLASCDSDQCGVGWLSPSEKEKLEAKVADLQQHLATLGVTHPHLVPARLLSDQCGEGLLEKQKVLVEALGYETPWPVGDVLRSLSHAASHLLHDHNCDHRGHETISSNAERALKMATAIEAAKQALDQTR